jgi:hypothetical protein
MANSVVRKWLGRGEKERDNIVVQKGMRYEMVKTQTHR